MTALCAIRKGQEIFNDYGSLPRSDLLRRYGYITDEYKQFDVLEIETQKIVEVVAAEQKLSKEEMQERASRRHLQSKNIH